MTSFITPTDIANRALQHCGAARLDPVLGFSESSTNASETFFAYDKLRAAELQRNIWEFAIENAVLRPIDTNTMLLAPALWVSTTTYFVGSIVSDATGQYWISLIPDNLGNNPLNTLAWEQYAGPLTVILYDSSQTYFAGELVYTTIGDGWYNVYQSRQNSNVLDPSLPNQWAATTTYFKDDVVQVFPAFAIGTTYAQGATVIDGGGNAYSSLTAGNIGHTPSSSPTFWVLTPVLTLTTPPAPATSPLTPLQSSPVIEWSVSTFYTSGSFVLFNAIEYLCVLNNAGNYPNAVASTFWKPLTGGTLYMSLIDLNINNPPASTPAAWTTTFTQGGGNSMWRQIGGPAFPMGVALTTLNIIYPIGAGPSSQSTTKNIYRLPSGFLRQAPVDPSAGARSYIGSPANLLATDWTFRGDYIVSRQADPIVFWFVADIVDVRKMDPMFCEFLAAKIAREVCERITQSSDKLKTIDAVLSQMKHEAILVNSILTGATDQPMDDYIATRL